ncbi:MAG: undecaprenyl-phosphate glucose phosphotransferase [Burkholderiaceae bacterium]|jgi:putative colanic acid biosynthesis UDP-glucose lipid carrier transferase|nr:undecaprenyl-phosphate glucose phosphotransferase [Burkholderiaceae bacterium]MEB2318915.1 undecaprenyl-phosphate glucose phosphotransferase [Pseudomonadota bacterium]
MADSRHGTLSQLQAQVRTGNSSLVALIKALVDPAIAVACLFLSSIAWGHPLGAPEMILGVLTFSLMYPSTVPFRHHQHGLVRQLASNWAIVLGLLVMFGLAIDVVRVFDQNVLATWAIGTPVAQTVAHLVSPYILPRLIALRGETTAIVIGASGLGQAMARSIADDPYNKTRVTAFFDDRELERLGEVTGAPIAGRIAEVANFVRANKIDQIFIALPMASQPRILKLLDDLRDTTASIYFVPDIFMYDIIQARIDTFAGMPVVAVCETPFHGTMGLMKRLSDILIATAAVILTAPVMLAVAIAIKITMPGPVLFKQRRYGLDGREIIVWKFRSMKVAEDGANVKQATKDDDRITPLGRFLRRTSLDELPQFFNVLQGRMSVVGPRPHAVAHNETYRKLIKGYMIRHKVKPGITGWAQINGARGETETVDKMAMRIRYDLEYLRNWSLRMDLYIVLRTALQALRDPQAY